MTVSLLSVARESDCSSEMGLKLRKQAGLRAKGCEGVPTWDENELCEWYKFCKPSNAILG